ncbi:porcupine [Holotrichia oblita]|nr:porcupine [Holotrichia oblita]
MVLAVALIYLSCIHLHRQIYDYASYTLDISGPLMIITQKVTSLAFCIHDGIARAETELSKSQKIYAVNKIPSALEYFSYALQFPSLMAGPALFYKDYIDFIDGKNLLPAPQPSGSSKDSATRIVVHEPSPTGAVFRKVTMAMIYVAIFVKFLPVFPITRVKESDFVENTSLLYKFWYLNGATMLMRFKYYFAWLFADAICNNSGMGFNGYDTNGKPQWDKFTNVFVLKFEVSLFTIF